MINTQLSVNERYKYVVDGYFYADLEEGASSSLPERDLQLLTQEIARKIIAASDLRPTFDATSGRTVSLREAVYFCVQDRDIKFNQDTPLAIESEGGEERSKEILGHVIKKLSTDFVAVQPDDLKAVALLFGVHRICDLAMGRMTQMPEPLPIIVNWETTLNRLVEMRARYALHPINPVTATFLAQIDAQIAQMSLELAEHALRS